MPKMMCRMGSSILQALNAELSKSWESIIEKKDAPPDADDWVDVTSKLDLLER